MRRKSPRPVFTGLFVLLGLLFAATAGHAAEVITNFRSDILLERNGEMTVTEAITVNAEGYQIRHGIFRDFPLTYRGPDGETHRVGFSILSTRRDGSDEDYHTETINNGIRIFMGSADTIVSPGVHTYALTYRTDRQIRFFADHDELFWNVTGNFWSFPIYSAQAFIRLPQNIESEAVTFFTGPMGGHGKNATASSNGDTVVFNTTAPLGVNEGLTVGIRMAQGSIDKPTESQTWFWWLSDNRNLVISAIGFLIVMPYFVIQWLRVGRDPSRGIVVPRWDLPNNISPSLARYIFRKGSISGDWTSFSAAVVDMAVKGYLKIDNHASGMTLSRTGSPPAIALPTGEDVILRAISKRGSSLTISKSNGVTIRDLGNEFFGAMEKEHQNKYHRSNSLTRFIGMVLTILSVLALVFFGDLNENVLPFLIAPTILFIVIGFFSGVLTNTIAHSLVFVYRAFATLLLVAFWVGFALVLYFSASAAIAYVEHQTDKFALLLSGLTIVFAMVFGSLMDASTPLGRQLLDAIEGLRLYLTIAEKDRMNMLGAPEMSPQHFETLLPYAIALGVERPWTEHFQTWLASASAAAQAYQPLWYAGDRFGSRNFSDSLSDLSSTMSSQIQSSLPEPPKSSSSGFSGGGSSGGGGGGGGGGGW